MLIYIIVVLSIWVLLGAVKTIANPILKWNAGEGAGEVIVYAILETLSFSIKVLALVFAILLL